MTVNKKLISILLSLFVALAFMPITEQAAFAAAPAAFSASGKVTGLWQSSAQYNNVTISWSAYPGAKGYQIYRANKKRGKYKKIKTTTSCSFTDKKNKKLGKKKYYKVRAYGTVGSSTQYTSYSGIISAKPRVGTPTGLTAYGASGGVTLKWNKVPRASGYQVYRSTSPGGSYSRLGTTKKLQYINTSLTKGTKYFYKVRAYKKKHGKKYGWFTGAVEGMTGVGVPGGFCSVLASNGTVTNTWNAVPGASGYQLQRASTTSGGYVVVGETSATSMTDRLTASGTYNYRVRAYSVMNGSKVYGDFSAGGRTAAVNQARSWVGCKESNGSHKQIIDVYNNYGPRYGKISYSTSWCAAFVSAVAIVTNNTNIIPVDCYCPRMMNSFASSTTNKSFTPQGGDVVFYDWNANKVPDHVGMVESVSGNDVTTIEGNYSDAVKRRTFKKGYSLLLSYGLPNYSISNVVSYSAAGYSAMSAASVSEDDVLKACGEIEAEEETAEPEADPAAVPAAEQPAEPETEAAAGAAEAVDGTEAEAVGTEAAAESEAGTPAEEPAFEAKAEASESEPATEVETAEKIVEYIQEEEPAEAAASEESTYNAFLVYGICDEMDIDACVVTITDGDGTERSYNEVVLDGELYILDATEEGGVLEKFTPEEIN